MKKRSHSLLLFLTLSTLFIGCDKKNPTADSNQESSEKTLTGTVQVDGSSTVFPITEAMAEEFQKKNRGVRVTVGLSGTGGGMKKFTAGTVDISGASRPIKSSELQKAQDNKIQFIELPVAYDGIVVVVNASNDYATSLTTQELKEIWRPDSPVKTWKDIRPEWPQEEIKLFGPGADSGTFDYFTEAVMGKSGSIRSDFTASEDDNVLVQGVSGETYALGYFGFAYWQENQSKLKVLAIDNGKGPVTPTLETIKTATYQPLARPIFIYIATASLDRSEVDAFAHFYLDHAPALVGEVGYVPLSDTIYEIAKRRLSQRVGGAPFAFSEPSDVESLVSTDVKPSL